MVRALCIDNAMVTLHIVKSIRQKGGSIVSNKTTYQRAYAAAEHQLNSSSQPVSLLVSMSIMYVLPSTTLNAWLRPCHCECSLLCNLCTCYSATLVAAPIITCLNCDDQVLSYSTWCRPCQSCPPVEGPETSECIVACRILPQEVMPRAFEPVWPELAMMPFVPHSSARESPRQGSPCHASHWHVRQVSSTHVPNPATRCATRAYVVPLAKIYAKVGGAIASSQPWDQ